MCSGHLLTNSSQVHSHVQGSQPVDPIFDELAEAVSSFENTEDRLLSRTIKVPHLQSLFNRIISQPSCSVTETEIFGLIRAAEDLDRELAHWARDVPAGWSYTMAMNLNPMFSPELACACYIPSEIHRYPDFYIARVWNLYRVSRLVVQSILLRADSWLCFPSQNGRHHRNIHIEKLNGVLVNDICASVPFLLGYNLSQLKRPDASMNFGVDKSIWPQSSPRKIGSSKHTGRFSLIWPLYLSCSVSSIPEAQRGWMRAQLRWIAEHDEPQARLVSGASSRTLLGGAEDFRFDCV